MRLVTPGAILVLVGLLVAPAAAAAQAPTQAQTQPPAGPEAETPEAETPAADTTPEAEAAEAQAAEAQPAPEAAGVEPAAPPPTAEEPNRPDVAVLSVGGDASRSDARRARAAVAAALRGDGMTPLPDSDVSLRISPSRLSGCQETRCAFAFGAELDVAFVAAVTTWAGDDGPSSVTVSLILGADRAYAATEDVGGPGLAAAASAAVSGAQDARRRAVIVEGASSAPDPHEPDEEEDDRDETVLSRERSLEEWILPSLLGVVGLGLVGTAVYALLDEQCEVRGVSGVCLKGSAPNYGLGILFSITGALSIGGAILWLIVGGQPQNAGSIDMVIGPDGGAVGYRGRF